MGWLVLGWLVGCGERMCREVAALPDAQDVLAIGDSVQAWGAASCNTLDDHLALARGSAVDRRAVSGTRMLGGEDDIPGQYAPGPWEWVVVDGGGNDVNQTCGCGDCGEVLDQLSTPDGQSGAMPALVDQILGDGSGVVLLLYYRMGPDPAYGFDRCPETLAALNTRYATLAQLRPEVLLVDLGRVMDPERTPEYYDFDDVHPSRAGAEALGTQVAEAMAQR